MQPPRTADGVSYVEEVMGVLGEVLVVITILGLSFAGLGLLIWHISKPIPPTEPRHRPYDTQPRQRPHDRTGGRKP